MLDPALQGTHLKRWTLRDMVHVDLASLPAGVALHILERLRGRGES